MNLRFSLVFGSDMQRFLWETDAIKRLLYKAAVVAWLHLFGPTRLSLARRVLHGCAPFCTAGFLPALLGLDALQNLGVRFEQSQVLFPWLAYIPSRRQHCCLVAFVCRDNLSLLAKRCLAVHLSKLLVPCESSDDLQTPVLTST